MRLALLLVIGLCLWSAHNAQARTAIYSPPHWYWVCPELPDQTMDPHRADCVLEWRR